MAGKHSKNDNTRPEKNTGSRRSNRYGGEVYIDPSAAREQKGQAPARRGVDRTDYENYRRAESRRDYDKPQKSGSGISTAMKVAIPVLIVLALAVGLLGWTMLQAVNVSRLETIYPNITINGVNVGGMTAEEASALLSSSGVNPYEGKTVTVNLPMDKSVSVTGDELGIVGDPFQAAQAAYDYGRDGSLLKNLKTYRACKKAPVAMNWEIDTAFDDAVILAKINPVISEINTQLLKSESAVVGEDSITIVKGVGAAAVDPQAVCAMIREAFQTQNYEPLEYELTEVDPESGEQVLKAIYDSVFTEPVNAKYDKETGGATESQVGVSFDMEAALALWNEAETGDEIVIPLIITQPEIDSETLLDKIFADCLSEKSTSLAGSSSNRINNVTLAAKALNNTVINPGETFDYNTCLGERTEARGYKGAGAYADGQHVTQVGGGICQNSSTLYYCALYANLDITVRYCHYFTVSYLPRGLDATVSWGGPDFRFVNTRDYPIKIKAWVDDGYLTVQLWGTDVDGSYVKMTSDTWEDNEYYYARTYRSVYDKDGNRIEYYEEAYSRYHKYEANTPTPEPTATTKPTGTPEPTNTPETTQPPAAEATPVPTGEPTAVPTSKPTAEPTPRPTAEPTPMPTPQPTAEPTPVPTPEPTAEPTPAPTDPPPPPTEEPAPDPAPTDSGSGGEISE